MSCTESTMFFDLVVKTTVRNIQIKGW